MDHEINLIPDVTNTEGREEKDTSKVFLTIEEAIDSIKNIKPVTELALKLPFTPGIYFLVGKAKSSKTILMENLAFSLLSDETSFLGKKCSSLKKVVFISLEEFYNNRTARNRTQFDSLSEDIKQMVKNNLYVLNSDYSRFLSTTDIRNKFLTDVKKTNADLIIIDSFSRLYLGSIENSIEAQIVMKYLRQIAVECQIPIIIIHHTTKMKPGVPLSLNLVAGSRIIAQETEGIIGVGVTSNGNRYVKPLAFRYADDKWEKLPMYRIKNDCIIDYLGDFTEAEILRQNDGRSDSNNMEQIENYIKSNYNVKSKQLEHEFVSNENMARSTLYENLNKSKKIIKSKKGVYRHVDCPPVLVNFKNDDNE